MLELRRRKRITLYYASGRCVFSELDVTITEQGVTVFHGDGYFTDWKSDGPRERYRCVLRDGGDGICLRALCALRKSASFPRRVFAACSSIGHWARGAHVTRVKGNAM